MKSKAKNNATIFLAIAFIIYISSEILCSIYNFYWIKYVTAFSEAAMVGGIADWFAITALFKHPLGLKIPHTAIIPKNKNKNGRNLSNFFRENFLSKEYVTKTLLDYPLSEKIADIIENKKQPILLKSKSVSLHFFENLDFERFYEVSKKIASSKIEGIDLKKIVIKIINDIGDKRYHHELINTILISVREWVKDPEHAAEVNRWIKRSIKTDKDGKNSFSGTIKSWFVGDTQLSQSVDNFIIYLNSEEGKELKNDIDFYFRKLMINLETNTSFSEKIENIKLSLVQNKDIDSMIRSLISEMRTFVINDLKNDNSKISSYANEILDSTVLKIRNDDNIKAKIKEKALYYLPNLIIKNAEKIDEYFINYIDNMDENEISELISEKVGDDLQYIRISGTIVGGVIGLAIFSLTQLVIVLI